jgi:hypothetical protein
MTAAVPAPPPASPPCSESLDAAAASGPVAAKRFVGVARRGAPGRGAAVLAVTAAGRVVGNAPRMVAWRAGAPHAGCQAPKRVLFFFLFRGLTPPQLPLPPLHSPACARPPTRRTWAPRSGPSSAARPRPRPVRPPRPPRASPSWARRRRAARPRPCRRRLRRTPPRRPRPRRRCSSSKTCRAWRRRRRCRRWCPGRRLDRRKEKN